jgi:hypothetical protein
MVGCTIALGWWWYILIRGYGEAKLLILWPGSERERKRKRLVSMLPSEGTSTMT